MVEASVDVLLSEVEAVPETRVPSAVVVEATGTSVELELADVEMV